MIDGGRSPFDCLDCVRPVELTKNGRCPFCGSDAIAPASGTNWEWQERWAVNELERLYAMPDVSPTGAAGDSSRSDF